MKILLTIAGLIAVLLGGLWFLQGTGLVHLKPILCVAACKPVEQPTPLWTAIGAVLVLIGLYGLWRAWRRR